MNMNSALDLLRRGRPLAATVTPHRSGALAWAGVYPLDVSQPSTTAVLRRLGVTLSHKDRPVFRIRVIEVGEHLLHSSACIGEDDLHSRADVVVEGEEALLNELDRLGVARGSLELPYKVDYPI
jgi:hypothetical protein